MADDFGSTFRPTPNPGMGGGASASPWGQVRAAWEGLRGEARQRTAKFQAEGGLRGHAARGLTSTINRYRGEAGRAELGRHGMSVLDRWLANKEAQHGAGYGIKSMVMSQMYSMAREHVQNHISRLGNDQRMFENTARVQRGDIAGMSDSELREISDNAHKFAAHGHEAHVLSSIENELSRRATEKVRHKAEAAEHFAGIRREAEIKATARREAERTKGHTERTEASSKARVETHRTVRMQEREHARSMVETRAEERRGKAADKAAERATVRTERAAEEARQSRRREEDRKGLRSHLSKLGGIKVGTQQALAEQRRRDAQAAHEQGVAHERVARSEHRKGLAALSRQLVPLMRDPMIGTRGVAEIGRASRGHAYTTQAYGGATWRLAEANLAGVRNDPAIVALWGSKYKAPRTPPKVPLHPAPGGKRSTVAEGRDVHAKSGKTARATAEAKAKQAQPKGSPRTRAEQASRHRAEKTEQAGGASYKVDLRTVRTKSGKTYKRRQRVRADAAGAKKRAARRK